MSTLYCPFRKVNIAAQPEEIVRQHLLQLMTERLGFPSGHIVVEKALKQLPHMSLSDRKNLPDRRVDILVYKNDQDKGLVPLLLIECKAVPLKHTALQQVAGYNHYIGAHYISAVNEKQVFMGWYNSKEGRYQTVDFLPTYEELCRSSTALK
ncbi:MAG: type I restriction enzyme HsdR N-terminal domain-containing protein [Chlamydiota bacterium]